MNDIGLKFICYIAIFIVLPIVLKLVGENRKSKSTPIQQKQPTVFTCYNPIVNDGVQNNGHWIENKTKYYTHRIIGSYNE